MLHGVLSVTGGHRVKLRELLAHFGGTASPDLSLDREISGVTTLSRGGETAISFFNGHHYYLPFLERTTAGVIVIAERSIPRLASLGKSYVCVDDPYLYFAYLTQYFAPERSPVCEVRHPSAVIASSAKIGTRVHVGPGVVIGEDVHIGSNVYLGPGVVLMDGVRIGSDCCLHAHVVIYHGCSLGNRNIIHAGSVIGADGFGYARAKDRHWVKIMQVGAVVIGDDCEIGACVTIDRGAIEDTVIGDGVKIDNQTQIGHNCRIGHHVVLSGHVSLAGSVRLGSFCRIGGASGIAGPLDVGDGVDLAGASFLSRLEDGVQLYAGCTPAVDGTRWLRRVSAAENLPELTKQVAKMAKQLDQLLAAQAEKEREDECE